MLEACRRAEEQDRSAEVRTLTFGCGKLNSPTKGNHVLCFEAIIIFLAGILEKKQKSQTILNL